MPAIDSVGGGQSDGSTRSFPGLEFDPTPGDAGAVIGLTTQLGVAIQTTRVTLPRLESAAKVTDKAVWGGGAADEFSDHADDLPLALGNGLTAMDAVSKALVAWHGKLVSNQSQADALEREAVRLKKEIAAAEAAADAASAAVPSNPNHPEYASRQEKAYQADNKARQLSDKLHFVKEAAVRLQRQHVQTAQQIADAIKKGADGEPFKPENDTFLVNLSDVIAKTGDTVSLITGTLAAALAVAAPLTGGASLAPAAVLGAASAGTGLLGAVGQLGQKLSGSRHAEGYLPIVLSLAGSGLGPGKLAIKGARRGAKAALGGKKITAKELEEALKDTPLPKLREDLKDIKDGTVRKAVEDDLRETGEEAARRFGVDPSKLTPERLQELGLASKAAAGVADLAGNAQSALEAAGVELSEEDKNRLRAIQLGLDPTDERAGKSLEDIAKDKAKKDKD